jgi:hypothetical protein
MSVVMTEREIQLRLKLKNNFPHYAYKCLMIRTKPGEILPFALNKPQLYLHSKIEEQRKKTGRVRVIILKGRQQGISTYVGGRFYHIVSHRTGYRAFILTHEQRATDNLFEMVKRYHTYCPLFVRPIEGANSSKELNFLSPESGYKVGTAGSKGIGRSNTIQLFHGSEVGLWENGIQHLDGIMQAIPRIANTEVILESTAQGKGNIFYNLWDEANRGENEFLPVFIPWYWSDEYREPLPVGLKVGDPGYFALTDEEHEYKKLYNLDNEQMHWRRITTNSSQLKELGFKQEYPSTAEEAFIVTGGNCIISSLSVEKARKCTVGASGVKFIGVDPAGGDPENMGSHRDRTSIIIRQGRVAYGLQSYQNKDTMQTVGILINLIKTEQPDFICIDVTGLGVGIIDRLRELGHGQIVKAVNFGGVALQEDRYANKRAEIWSLMGDWLKEVPVSIPDSDSLHSDLCAPFYDADSLGRVTLESKDRMRARGVRSPDEGDALALTFAFPALRNNANIGNIYNPNIRI